MATTRIMSLHIGKGRTVGKAISDIIDYVENPDKTDGGRLISSYQCDSRIADAEFLFAKRQYLAKTGRKRGADDVIAYTIRQSFVPGEITPEEANRLGYELARRFTKGNHGSHGDLDAGATIVGVHHHQIGGDLVPSNDVAVGHPCQHPDLAATLQGPGSLVGHASTQQIIGELESILVLHHLVAVTDDTKGGAVGAAGVHFVPCDQGAILRVDVLLDDIPIQASIDQSVGGGGSLLHLSTQAMPGFFTDIEHSFNISGHYFYLLR